MAEDEAPFKLPKKDCDYGDEAKIATPKPKGGRRSTRPRSPAQLAQQWQPGQSGNPGGRAKSVAEFQKLIRGEDIPQAREVVKSILLDETACNRDRLKAAELLFDRGLGKPPVIVGNVTDGDMGHLGVGIDGEPLTALLLSARLEKAKKEAAVKAKQANGKAEGEES